MESLHKEILNQVIRVSGGLKPLQQNSKGQMCIEIEFRLGTIHLYNKQAFNDAWTIQPLYTQLPNKKVVKHHQFQAYIDEKYFLHIVDKLKQTYVNYQQFEQVDYIYSDESKLTTQVINNLKQITRQIKKQPLIQDIDIYTDKQYDIRFSCKSVNPTEINTNTVSPQLQRSRQIFIFKTAKTLDMPDDISDKMFTTADIEIHCSMVSTKSNNKTQLNKQNTYTNEVTKTTNTIAIQGTQSTQQQRVSIDSINQQQQYISYEIEIKSQYYKSNESEIVFDDALKILNYLLDI